ncbi:MAG: DUF167 domain-containing protein [Armatimonadetes bacterium]|nr:DUF167 domain-containing protein [Armatimonadota bacterium]
MVEEKLILPIRVQPRASRNEVVGWKEGRLNVRLTAPPVEGAANRAVVDFMAERLGVKRYRIALVSGEKSREKVLEVVGLSREELEKRLGVGGRQ